MKLTRRQFLGASAAVGALALASGKIVNYLDKDVFAVAGEEIKEETWIPTHCKGCAADNRCHILVRRVNGVVVKIEGNPESPTNLGRNCAKSNAALMTLYNPYRVKFPVKRTNPEKGLGVDPKWVEISWEEALETVATKLKKVRAEDPRKFVFMVGHAASLNIDTDEAFAHAFGTPNTIVGATSVACGGSASPINVLINGGYQARADMLYCKYFLNLGANSQQGGKGNTEEIDAFVNARAQGLKVVNVTPVISPSIAKTDEWVPIIPGTTGYFLLSMINVIINELKVWDAPYLKNRTNAGYLVDEDGLYIRTADQLDDKVRGQKLGKPMVWDSVANAAKAFDDPTVQDVALEGVFEVNGKKCRPSFQVLKEHVKGYTPEKGRDITGIAPEVVRRLAREWVDNAQIGRTIIIDGVTYPYRPVAVIAEQGAKCHVDNYFVVHAAKILAQIVGATDVPGSAKAAGRPFVTINPVDGMNTCREFYYRPLKKVPDKISLEDHSPIPGSSSGLAWITMKDPKAYGFEYTPEVLGIWGGNPQALLGDPKHLDEVFRKFSFIFAISYEFDAPTEYADIVLPESSWLERYGISALAPRTSFTSAFREKGTYGLALQQPVLEKPLYNTKEGNQIILELSERLGILKGPNGVLAQLNSGLRLGKYSLNVEKTYTWEEIMDRQCKAKTNGMYDLAWFKKNGLLLVKAFGVKEYYGYSRFPKARFPLYIEEFASHRQRLERELAEKGIVRRPGNDFVLKYFAPLPSWEPHPEHKAAGEFDLYCINYKNMQHHFACNISNPWLMDLTVAQDPYSLHIVMNAATARQRGLKDGDLVELTSFTGGKVQGKIRTSQVIHHDVLAIAGAYGHRYANTNPATAVGPAFVDLLKLSEEYINPLKICLDRDTKVKLQKL
ncbi:molybdopterin oxidoreductase Fe4S4 region [Thermosinus carboxydivorans Nor1]|uniref:Molybdopterin oxidoreductase Fe4S4 region n=1 Tax=Thermosinus carboxydivorans Nor1 TaxID=401526 RepID=A1HNC0_9FIRM|nr:molybdopterin-dependent oxidoreductase [Thermosinus carboxydivorans]EAX48284.1 molybdopterin oxidoreductase Fe4S4 region [Thermosinus carboxydivorans Nor1]